MDWFRMYSEFASDPKVQSMSEAMQRRLMMLLCLRCSNTLVTLQDDEIAFALRISEEDLAQTKVLFIKKSFINDAWEILQWDKRQFVSDSSATRVARHRAAKKEAEEAAKNTAENECNVTVTPQNRTDTDTEQIQNKKNIPPQAANSIAPKKSRKKPSIPLPEDFGISENVQAWAEANNVQNLDRHFASFINKVKAKGYVYADWDAALRNAITDDWAKLNTPPARASPEKPVKFDPVAHVNRNRIPQ